MKKTMKHLKQFENYSEKIYQEIPGEEYEDDGYDTV